MSTLPSCDPSRQKTALLSAAAAAFARRFLSPAITADLDKSCAALSSGIEEIAAVGTAENRMPICDKAIVRCDAVNLIFRSFLRSSGILTWDKDAAETREARKACSRPDFGLTQLMPVVETKTDDEVANTLICLVCQIQHQLDQMQKQHELVYMAAGGNADKLRLLRSGKRK